MRSPARLQPQLRALPLLSSLPACCVVLPVTNDLNAPHLRTGEFAVIDASERQPINGELFGIAYRSGVARGPTKQ